MQRHPGKGLMVAAVSLALSGVAYAQNGAPVSSAATSSRPAAGAQAVPRADRQFADKAAEAGMAEVAAGKLAQEKAASDSVKQFGERMVRDHTNANEQLHQVASSQALSIPDKLDATGRKELDALSKLSGDKFDTTYMKKQVSHHEKVIKAFEKEAKSGNDAAMKRFAADTLPTLKEHLKLAKQTQSGLHSASTQSKKAGQAQDGAGSSANPAGGTKGAAGKQG